MINNSESYLRVIYRFRNDAGEIKPNAIAGHLHVSQPAVTEMLKKLAKRKLIVYTPYKAVRCTEKGESLAMQLVRRHRIWEIFLHKVVGMPLHQVHEEAARLEQYASDDLINRLDELLRYPQFDPHGDPIPAKNGALPRQKTLQPLGNMRIRQKGVVARVNDFNSSFLRFIAGIGISLDSEIEVIEKREFDQSLVVKINKKEQILSGFAASNIFVHPAKN
jgi:DtxR family Mn-dependent transcriptional regulator